jgi:hypothetical protein
LKASDALRSLQVAFKDPEAADFLVVVASGVVKIEVAIVAKEIGRRSFTSEPHGTLRSGNSKSCFALRTGIALRAL